VKDFLSVLDLGSPEALHRLLRLALQLKTDRHRGLRAPTAKSLDGSHVALLFEKPSLRTRSTFEVAVKELGGEVLNLSTEFAGGREPLEDVARNLERWVRVLVIRTFAQERARLLANAAPRLSVINALTDEQHPCQALADAMRLVEQWGDCRGRRIAFVGDGNNVATSLAHVTSMRVKGDGRQRNSTSVPRVSITPSAFGPRGRQPSQQFLHDVGPVHAVIAESDGRIAGLGHYLFHRSTILREPICYMQDLFTAEAQRGRGVGRALIARVCEEAARAGCTRVYWHTHESNDNAMRLYDAVAEKSGFIVYRRALSPA